MPGGPSSITTAVVGLLESAASGATINIAMYEADNGRVTNVSADMTLIKQAIKLSCFPHLDAFDVVEIVDRKNTATYAQVLAANGCAP